MGAGNDTAELSVFLFQSSSDGSCVIIKPLLAQVSTACLVVRAFHLKKKKEIMQTTGGSCLIRGLWGSSDFPSGKSDLGVAFHSVGTKQQSKKPIYSRTPPGTLSQKWEVHEVQQSDRAALTLPFHGEIFSGGRWSRVTFSHFQTSFHIHYCGLGLVTQCSASDR